MIVDVHGDQPRNEQFQRIMRHEQTARLLQRALFTDAEPNLRGRTVVNVETVFRLA